MPKRKCNTCHQRHNPPTDADIADIDLSKKVDLVLDNLGILTERIHAIENKTADSLNDHHEINSPDTSSDEHINDVTETATAKTLQRDKTLSKKLRQRLSQLELLGDVSDSDSEADQKLPSSKGKKSGRAKTVHDIIIKDIDWPHFHVPQASKILVYQNSYMALPLKCPGNVMKKSVN